MALHLGTIHPFPPPSLALQTRRSQLMKDTETNPKRWLDQPC